MLLTNYFTNLYIDTNRGKFHQCSIYSPKYIPIFLKVSSEVVFKEERISSILRIFEKFRFLQKQHGPNYWKNKYYQGKTSAIGLSKYVKTKTLSCLDFKWKIGLPFAVFKHFGAKDNLFSKFFCYIIWVVIWRVRRDSGRLANEGFTSNPIVSSKQ